MCLAISSFLPAPKGKTQLSWWPENEPNILFSSRESCFRLPLGGYRSIASCKASSTTSLQIPATSVITTDRKCSPSASIHLCNRLFENPHSCRLLRALRAFLRNQHSSVSSLLQRTIRKRNVFRHFRENFLFLDSKKHFSRSLTRVLTTDEGSRVGLPSSLSPSKALRIDCPNTESLEATSNAWTGEFVVTTESRHRASEAPFVT